MNDLFWGLCSWHLWYEVFFENLLAVYGFRKFWNYCIKALCLCFYKRGFQFVRLDDLKPDHGIDKRIPSSYKSQLQRKADILKALEFDTLFIPFEEKKKIAWDTLRVLCPSTTPLLCFVESGEFIIYDGNGRLFALKEALTSQPFDIWVECKVHFLRFSWPKYFYSWLNAFLCLLFYKQVLILLHYLATLAKSFFFKPSFQMAA